MVAIISLLMTLAFSLLITRVAAIALTLTGLSIEVARFQARSAFTGVGFTTSEAETIVNHPVRRRIVGTLMLFGNLGIAAVIASTIASFTSAQSTDAKIWMFRLASLALGLFVLWLIASSRWIDRVISRWIEWALLKWTRLDVRDYVSLLHLSDGYVVLELQVNEGDWVADRALHESRLSKEGVLVLGIHRASGRYIGSPNGEIVLRVGDVLSLYGPIQRLEELDLRKKGYDGDRAHRIAVKVQEEIAKDDLKEGESAGETTSKPDNAATGSSASSAETEDSSGN